MHELTFTTKIQSSNQTVWDTLWQDETLRQWAGIIDPGTYMIGELIEGSEVQFISAENGYGVSSLVEKLIPGEYVLFRHQADTQNTGTQERDKQWTGGKEQYQLTTTDNMTTLTATFDVPPELEDYFNEHFPKALSKIKELAEQNTELITR